MPVSQKNFFREMLASPLRTGFHVGAITAISESLTALSEYEKSCHKF